MKSLLKSRYAGVTAFILYYLIAAFVVRLALTILSFKAVAGQLGKVLLSFLVGLSFDLCIAFCFVLIYSLYLLLCPSKLIGSIIDKVLSYALLALMFFISLFSFAAEFPFWDEFKNRFNFIAVDYLIYTYEVVENINQSYPIPVLILGLGLMIAVLFFIFKRKNIFKNTFSDKMRFGKRLLYTFVIFIIGLGSLSFLKNDQAEISDNTYVNELSKNGVFSFFTAFKANELDYMKFYPTLPDQQAYSILKKELLQPGMHYVNNHQENITREVEGTSTATPNIVLICIESFSADFLHRFGNQENLTPIYEGLAKESLFFTNVFATGTRTVRGMEALTLSVPPTPGNSIVRRANNDQLFSIASILKQKNYELSFIYGGDGYFDNMNAFFGGQGFSIIDRNRGNPLPDNIHTERINIEDKEVSFENAWGICDEDIYKQSLKRADTQAKDGKPFFQFVMTTSNHKPYTFPDGKIQMAQGSREAAVRYTDFALGEYIKQAKTKSWFKNTVFVVIADHCASSAGRWEINTENHHIPAIIYNLPSAEKGEIGKLVSQIDIMPTLFSRLGWQYKTALYGKDIFKMKPEEERALIGNYRTLGLLKNGIFTQINDRKATQQFQFNPETRKISGELGKTVDSLKNITISYYQTASERFKSGKMKAKNN